MEERRPDMGSPTLETQLAELKKLCKSVLGFNDASGRQLYKLEELRLPAGCTPGTSDAVLVPFDTGDGYPSKLYFPSRIKCPATMNWYHNTVFFGTSWCATSWKTAVSNPGLADIVRLHLHSMVRA